MSEATPVIDGGPDVHSTTGELGADALYEKCMMLARNVWWSWHYEVINLFRDLDPDSLEAVGPQSDCVAARVHAGTVGVPGGGDGALQPDQLCREAAEGVHHHATAVGSDACQRAGGQARRLLFRRVWFARVVADLLGRPGGLVRRPHQERQRARRPSCGCRVVLQPGVFSSASGPATAGRRKTTRTRGSKTRRWNPARTRDGKPITVRIDTRDGKLFAKVWLVNVGRVPLYLLDSNVEGNKPEDRELTNRLYGGNERTRVRQELLLGVGGVRALRALSIHPGVYHLNEGHSALRRWRWCASGCRMTVCRSMTPCATSPTTRCLPRTHRYPRDTTDSMAV